MLDRDKLVGELSFKFARSGGAGGQHVNKVSSKVLLQWFIGGSEVYSDEEKIKLREQLSNRINKEDVFQLECDTDRSQLKNKGIAIERFLQIVTTTLKPVKPRKKTKIPYGKILNRLDRKSKQGELKKSRSKNIDF